MKNWLFCFAVALSTCSISCNSTTAEQSKPLSSSTINNSENNQDSSSISINAQLQGDIPYLLLKKASADSLYALTSSGGKRRLVFQFFFRTQVPNPLLIAYSAKKVDTFHVPGLILDTAGRYKSVSGNIILGNVELRFKKYKQLKQQVQPSQWNYLYFEPMLATEQGQVYLRYNVQLAMVTLNAFDKILSITPITTAEQLDPCPPKRPCGGDQDCD